MPCDKNRDMTCSNKATLGYRTLKYYLTDWVYSEKCMLRRSLLCEHQVLVRQLTHCGTSPIGPIL